MYTPVFVVLCFALTISFGWSFTANQKQALRMHNYYRARHGAAPLTMDPGLNQGAQSWADNMARKGRMEHSPPNLRVNLGENLAYSMGMPDPVSVGINGWYDEVNSYRFSGSGENALHFTQMVWKATKKLGFGVGKSADGKTYLVARYSPAGNYGGEYTANVQAAIPGSPRGPPAGAAGGGGGAAAGGRRRYGGSPRRVNANGGYQRRRFRPYYGS